MIAICSANVSSLPERVDTATQMRSPVAPADASQLLRNADGPLGVDDGSSGGTPDRIAEISDDRARLVRQVFSNEARSVLSLLLQRL